MKEYSFLSKETAIGKEKYIPFQRAIRERSYLPEGILSERNENNVCFSSPRHLERAMNEGRILEAPAVACRADTLELSVDLGCAVGTIPKSEVALGANNSSGQRDIAVITRVGHPVCFVITELWQEGGKWHASLSRKKAQEMCLCEYISKLTPGDIIPACVTHLDPFGAFVDIGCGIISLLNVDCVSVSRITHTKERLKKGQMIYTAVKAVDRENGRIYMTLRELLGTWEENAAAFSVGEAVVGTVRSVESYGIFVELTPNLAGLAEKKEGVKVGDSCSVYIKNIIKDRMKIKLSIIDCFSNTNPPVPLEYYISPPKTNHISYWRYSPEGASKIIETVF